MGEGGEIRENGIETCIISYMKRIASPGSINNTGCLGWCTGITQRDGTGKEVGGGYKMGKQWLSLFFWAPKSLQMVIAAIKLKEAYSLEVEL